MNKFTLFILTSVVILISGCTNSAPAMSSSESKNTVLFMMGTTDAYDVNCEPLSRSGISLRLDLLAFTNISSHNYQRYPRYKEVYNNKSKKSCQDQKTTMGNIYNEYF